MYINPATLKKFIELIKNKKVDETSVSLPIKPMYKVVYLNPQVTIGITGLRHIQKSRRIINLASNLNEKGTCK